MMMILPGEPELASFHFTLPLHTSSLTPSHHVLLRQEERLSEGRGVEGKYIS